MRDIFNFRLCESAIALELVVVTIFKSPINPITNPYPFCSHTNRVTVLKTTSASKMTENTREKIYGNMCLEVLVAHANTNTLYTHTPTIKMLH
jgi:hypothetical protein